MQPQVALLYILINISRKLCRDAAFAFKWIILPPQAFILHLDNGGI